MSKQNLWYGFLEAEERSSPVIIDNSMDTGEKRTVFIYNHSKKEILKYVREVVEPKLRELTDKEKELEASMKKGFTESLKTFNNKVPNLLAVPAKGKPSAKAESTPEEPEAAISDPDDDVWDDSDE